MRRGGRRLALGLLPLVLGSCAPTTSPPRPVQVVSSLPPSAPLVSSAPRIVAVSGLDSFRPEGSAVQGGLLRGHVPERTVSLTLSGAPVPFAPDRSFIIGFGRDAKPSAVLEARLDDGLVYKGPIAVAQRRWDIQSIPGLRKGTAPTPEFLVRRKAELAQIGAARAIASDSQGWRQHFVWPATGRISGVFGSQRIYAGEPGEPHSGVDVAQPSGTPVVAPADGVVVLAAASPFTLEGNLLMIDHGMGLNSAFLHLSRIDVAVGDRVRQGQPVGAIGMTGRASGPHLHWGMKWQDVRIDPALLAGAMP